MCIFCRIVSNEIPAYKVYEDDSFLAFLDISQATLGHTLVIPKKHVENILTLDEETASNLFALTTLLTKKICQALGVNDVNIINNNGLLAGQTISHVHLHILPRYPQDQLKVHFGKQDLTKDQFITLQQKILGN